MELLVAMLYVVGNFQGFSDGTQYRLVTGLQTLSAVVIAGSLLAGFFWLLAAFLLKRVRFFWGTLGMIVLSLVAAGFVLGATAIVVLQQPV